MTLLGSKRAHTTAYPRQSNSMVDWFHCQLKAGLKAQHNPSSWIDALSFMLLGIRTVLKVDTSSTAAEMVYGTTLRLSRKFFAAFPTTSPYKKELSNEWGFVNCHPCVDSTRCCVQILTTLHMMDPTPWSRALTTISLWTLMVTVSIDCLKPAHLDIVDDTYITPQAGPKTTPAPCRVTHSGGWVHWPKYPSSYVHAVRHWERSGVVNWLNFDLVSSFINIFHP